MIYGRWDWKGDIQEGMEKVIYGRCGRKVCKEGGSCEVVIRKVRL